MTMYLGDFAEDTVVHFKWSTNDKSGASITRAVNGTVSVYKADNTIQSTAGITDTEDFDGLTGIHHCKIDTSADGFYATGNDYQVVLSVATIDGESVRAVLAHFSIENRPVFLSAKAKLDINAEADTALSDYGGPTTAEMDAAHALLATAAVLAATNVGVGVILINTAEIGVAGAGLTGLGGMSAGMKAEVNAEADKALIDVNLAYLMPVIGLSLLEVTSSSFNTSLAEETDNHFRNMTVFFVSGALANQPRRVSAYDGTARRITVDPPFTGTVETLSNFIIVNAPYMEVVSRELATQAKADVNAECDKALADYDGPTKAEMDAAHAALSTSTVTIGAIVASSDPGNRVGSPATLEMFQDSKRTFVLTILDANGVAVDLSTKALRFVVHDENNPPNGVFKIEEPAITVTGTNDEVANVPVGTVESATATANLRWLLWDVDVDEVLAHGAFVIRPADKDVP